MKKILTVLMGFFLVFSVIGSASALQFSIDEANSKIELYNTHEGDWFLGGSDISAALATPYAEPFVLAGDGATTTFNFATVTLKGYGLGAKGKTDVRATLAFDTGISPYVAEGSSKWVTLFGGILDAGHLTWNTGPGTITLANGDYFDIYFKDIKGISLCESQYNIEAVVTGHSASVPEPATMFLMATGLLGLGVFRKKFRKD